MDVLVILKDLPGVREVEDLSVWVVLEGIQKGRGGFGKEHAFAPAGGHGGSERGGGRREMMGGRKRRGKGGGRGAAGG